MNIDERYFQFIDAVIAKDWEKANRIALDLEQGEQMDVFQMIGGNAL